MRFPNPKRNNSHFEELRSAFADLAEALDLVDKAEHRLRQANLDPPADALHPIAVSLTEYLEGQEDWEDGIRI